MKKFIHVLLGLFLSLSVNAGYFDTSTGTQIQHVATHKGQQIVRDVVSMSAFGEKLIVEPTPVFQNDFSYDLNLELWNNHSNSGTATIDTNRLKLSTGAAANQSAVVESIIPIKYHPGQGALVRFTAIFDTCTAGSEQLAGVGEAGDGFFFGCNGDTFGILRRVGGNHEIRTFTVTTASTTGENVTVTLDGETKSVAVTNSNNKTTTANEIAAADYSAVGNGWTAHAEGDTVIFRSYDADATMTGTYSLSATTAVASVARTLAGVAPTDNWVAQTSWNKDKADGTDHLPLLDWEKGNVFQIQYQWLGFGRIIFSVEDPGDGEYNPVHSIDFANTSTTPTVYAPSLPIYIGAKNTTNTTDIVMYSASVGGFTEGLRNGGHVHHGISNAATGITTETPVLTIHNSHLYAGKENRNLIKLIFLSIATEGTKNSTIKIYTGCTLTDASFSAIGTYSMVEYDTSATAVSGCTEQFALGMAKSDSETLDLEQKTFYLPPGRFLTITATSSASVDVTASFNWEELF